MKIESIIRRKNGHDVTFDEGQPTSATYSFRPDADPAKDFIVEVENTEHLQRFLCIREGYRIPKSAIAAAAKTPVEPGKPAVIVPPKVATPPAPAAEADVGLLGSSVHPAVFDIHGTTYTLGDIVNMAFAASGMTSESWNALEEDIRHGLLDAQLDRLDQATGDDVPPGEQDAPELSPEAERAELADEYKTLFNKLPPKTMAVDKIREKIADAKAKQ